MISCAGPLCFRQGLNSQCGMKRAKYSASGQAIYADTFVSPSEVITSCDSHRQSVNSCSTLVFALQWQVETVTRCSKRIWNNADHHSQHAYGPLSRELLITPFSKQHRRGETIRLLPKGVSDNTAELTHDRKRRPPQRRIEKIRGQWREECCNMVRRNRVSPDDHALGRDGMVYGAWGWISEKFLTVHRTPC